MSRGPDAGTLLVRALYRDSCKAGCPLEIVTSDFVRWSSATFTGARHASTWRGVPSPVLDAWTAAREPCTNPPSMRHLLMSVALGLVLGQTGACSKSPCDELEDQLMACPRFQDDDALIDCSGSDVNDQALSILQSGVDVCSVDDYFAANAACEK